MISISEIHININPEKFIKNIKKLKRLKGGGVQAF